MEEPAALLAKCEEFVEFLAAHDEHAKLRRLRDDIEALCNRLRGELEEGRGSDSAG